MSECLIQQFVNKDKQTITDACKTMSDADLFQLAAELAEATDIVQQYVKGDHPEMYDIHNALENISEDFFEKAEAAK